MTSPCISFYMTVKNGGRYIREAVDSIIAQDIDDWEAVIVDDGSIDDTPDYLKELSAGDPRFRVKLTPGVGRGKALNMAVSMCRADIVTNLDADDLAHPSRARLMLKLFTDNPHYTAISGSSEIFFDDEYPRWSQNSEQACVLEDVTKKLAYANPVGHSGVAMRKEVLTRVGAYDQSRLSQFDYELWVRLAEHGHRIGRAGAEVAAKRSHSRQSYERRAHLRYALRSAKIRWRAVSAVGVSRLRSAANIVALLLWAAAPAHVRMLVRRAGWLK